MRLKICKSLITTNFDFEFTDAYVGIDGSTIYIMYQTNCKNQTERIKFACSKFLLSLWFS